MTTSCTSPLTVTLVWRTTRPSAEITPNLAMFVHVIDETEQLLGQVDGPPLGLRPQLVPSVGGRLIYDVRAIDIDSGQPDRLRLGVYDFALSQRLTATDAQGQLLADDIFYTPVTPCP
jgi:hypothetical protein